MNISESQLNGFVSVILAVLVFVISYQGIYRMRTREIERIHKETVLLDEKLKVLKSVVEGNETTQGLARSLEGFAGLPELVARINEMAQTAEVTVNRIVPGEARVDEFVELQPVQISMECTYHSLGSFISLVESEGPHLRIEKVNLARGSAAAARESRRSQEPAEVRTGEGSRAVLTVIGIRAVR